MQRTHFAVASRPIASNSCLANLPSSAALRQAARRTAGASRFEKSPASPWDSIVFEMSAVC